MSINDEMYGGNFKWFDMDEINRQYDNGDLDINDYLKYFKQTYEYQRMKAGISGKRKRSEKSSKDDV